MTALSPSYEELQRRISELEVENSRLQQNVSFTEILHKSGVSQILESIDDVIWYRTDDKVLFANAAFERIWGIPVTELYANPQVFVNSIHPDDKPRILEALSSEEFRRTGKFDETYRIVRPDGHIRYISAKAFPIATDEPIGSLRVGLARNISDHWLVSETNKAMAEMLDIAPSSITVHDTNGKFYYVNKKTFEIHGYSKEEFMSLNLKDIDIPESVELLLARFDQIAKNGHATFEVGHFKSDSSIIYLEVYAKTVVWKGRNCILSIATDITRRRRYQSELQQKNLELQNEKELALQREQFVESITSQSPDIIYVHDLRICKNTYINKNLREQLGYPVGSVPEDSTELINELIHPDDLKLFYYSDLIENWPIEYVHHFEFRLKDAAGSWRWFSGREKEFVRENGRVVSLVGIVSDVTIQKRVQEELIAAKEKAEENDRYKTVFLQNMSHEIRTPMNAIVGFSNLLTRKGLPESKISKYSEIIRTNSYELLNVVYDILTISTLLTKSEKVAESRVDVSAFLSDIHRKFKPEAHRKQLDFILDFVDDKQFVFVFDKEKVGFILDKLLSNALKFTDFGFVRLGFLWKESYLEFYVEDSGIGISEAQKGHVFEFFNKGSLSTDPKYRGVGLGLSIALGYVNLLHGKIWFESELGRGSVFRFQIPVCCNESSNNENICENNSNKRSFIINQDLKVVVIADDEVINFHLIEEMLADTKYKLVHTRNGKETVDYCISNPPALVLMDVKMPVMDGTEAARIIKESLPELPIIGQTAYSLSNECKLYGKFFDDYLIKPFGQNTLKEKIAKYI